VYPENCSDLVESLLEALEVTGEEPVTTPENCVVPVRIALAKAYVITACSDEFLMTLARLAADPG
jgi:sulfite reductase alpha subunit-like flavoprotein